MYSLYIYSLKWELEAQIFDINNIKLTEKINDISTLSLDIDYKSDYANSKNLIIWKKVALVKISWKVEKELISGYLSEIEANSSKLKIKILSEEILLERRVLKSNVSISGSIKSALRLLLNKSKDNISVESIEDWVYKEYSAWINYLDILKDIAWSKYEFKLKWGVLTFQKSIWKDRRLKENYKEFKHNIREYWDSNIKDFKIKRNLESLANCIVAIWKRKYISVREESDSINEFWRFEETIKTKSFDWNSEYEAYIKSKKKWEIEYEIFPISSDYFEVWVWDLVPVIIETWNDLTRTEESLKVIEKSLEVKDMNIIKIKLSKSSKGKNSFQNRLKSLEESVNGLELS